MTLPRRGSRRILVDDIPFRFMVSRPDAKALRLNVTVEHDRHPGKYLLATLDIRRLDAIGTTAIGALIRFGVAAGWAPHIPGSPGRPFRLSDAQIDDALVSVGQ